MWVLGAIIRMRRPMTATLPHLRRCFVWEKYDDDLDGLILHCDYADLYQDKPIRECATPF